MDTVVPEVPQVVDASVKPGSMPDANKVEIYRNVFDEFDLDHGGTISVSELADAMRKLSGGLPVTDEAIKEMMASVDNDGSGDIGFDEFCKLMAARSDPAEELQAAFLAFDVDGSGSISAVEVKALLANLGIEITDDEADELIAVADSGELGTHTTQQPGGCALTALRDHRSGELSFKEFQVMIQSNNSSTMAKVQKAAMMAGVASKMQKLVLNAGLLENGSFCFRECSYDVPVNAGPGCTVKALGASASIGAAGRGDQYKTIISGMSGSVETGRMLAIIGPSGAGKTTLMNMLRLKQGQGIANGSITLNGVPFTGALYEEHAAAVEQTASVWPMLTVREQLAYTFELVRPSLNANERKAAIDEMLDSLGLMKVQHVKAGGGLSGGELRRLSLAAGLAKRPSLLFLDEPTTGLDSAAAAGVMDVVSQLAKMANTAVICVIHQPSEAIYSKFDKVLLLSCGRTAYNGPASGIPMHFSLLGYQCPARASISEFAMNLINREFAADPAQVDIFLDTWATRPPSDTPERLPLVHAPPRAGFLGSFMVLARRYMRISMTDFNLYTARLVMFALTSVFIAFYFFDARTREQKNVIPFMWALTLANWNGIFSMVGALPILQQISQKQIGEMRDGSYSYVGALVAPLVTELLMIILLSVAALAPAYAILKINWISFGPAVGLTALSFLTFESFTGVCAMTRSVAVGSTCWMLGTFTLFFPLFTLEKNVVWPFRLVSVFTPLRYFSSSYFYSVLSQEPSFLGAKLDSSAVKGYSCDNKWTQCFGNTGMQVLNSTIEVGFMPERTTDNEVARDVVILIAWIVFFKLATLIMTRNAVQPVLPQPPQKNKLIQGETVLLVKASKRDAHTISKPKAATAVFDFRNMRYDIKANGKVTNILNNVSGSVETGRMLAIIGPSGAGKTTLLKALQMKPGPGTASGNVTLNGVPFTGALCRQHAAAVEQTASVWPMLTVREQLAYTVELVQPLLSAEEKGDLVDEIVEGFGLMEVQHVKAGGGLSGGELRRLSLAAGLAKRPSLLFLDEPTTGLDSAAAAGVMDVVSQLAKMANTAVICVIHQPSEAIYSKFDKVLLLSCGRTAYNGPASGIPMHFKSIGKPFPDGMSVSEAALSITNRDFAADPTAVDKVLDAWATKETLPALVSAKMIAEPPRMANAMEQLSTLTMRGVVNFNRDPINWLGRIGIHIVMQLLLGAFVPGSEWNQAQIQIRNGGIIVMLMIVSMLPAINISFYASEMSLLAKEVREGKVNPFVYVLVSTGVQLPAICITSVISMGIFFGIQGSTWSTFGHSVGLMVAFINVYESLAQAFSSLGVASGMLMYMFLVDQGNTFNGVFSPIPKTEYPFKFLCAITPARQMVTSLTYLQYSVSRDFSGASECKWFNTNDYCLAGSTFYCEGGGACFGRTGKEILSSLEYQGYDKSEDQVLPRVLIMVYFIMLLKLISVLSLYKRAVVAVPKKLNSII